MWEICEEKAPSQRETFLDLQWIEKNILNVLEWAKMSQKFLYVQLVYVLHREETPS